MEDTAQPDADEARVFAEVARTVEADPEEFAEAVAWYRERYPFAAVREKADALEQERRESEQGTTTAHLRGRDPATALLRAVRILIQEGIPWGAPDDERQRQIRRILLVGNLATNPSATVGADSMPWGEGVFSRKNAWKTIVEMGPRSKIGEPPMTVVPAKTYRERFVNVLERACAGYRPSSPAAASDAEADLEPLTDTEAAILQVLLDLPEGQGLTGPEMEKALVEIGAVVSGVSTISRICTQQLEQYIVNPGGGRGYHLRAGVRDRVRSLLEAR